MAPLARDRTCWAASHLYAVYLILDGNAKLQRTSHVFIHYTTSYDILDKVHRDAHKQSNPLPATPYQVLGCAMFITLTVIDFVTSMRRGIKCPSCSPVHTASIEIWSRSPPGPTALC